MPSEGHEPDLLSDISDFDLVRHLLADLYDDLSGKIARFRQLVDLSDALGSSGTMLFGGEITRAAWREARWSLIHGNFAATVLLCQGLAEHLLGSLFHAALLVDASQKRLSFAETLQRCQERKVISDRDATDLRRLMNLRNPALPLSRDKRSGGSLGASAGDYGARGGAFAARRKLCNRPCRTGPRAADL